MNPEVERLHASACRYYSGTSSALKLLAEVIMSMVSRITVFILFLCGVPSAPLYAQVDPGEFSVVGSITDGEWIIYDTDNSNLPSNNITSLAIGGDGVAWIGTDTGIARLDGQRWTTFRLQGSHIFSVAAESQSSASRTSTRTLPSVWAAVGDTIDGELVGLGLAHFGGRRWVGIDTSNSGLHSNDIRNIGFGFSGTGWAIPASGFTLSHYDGVDWSAHSALSEIDQRLYLRAGLTGYSAGVVDKDGIIWLALGGTVSRFDGESRASVFVGASGGEQLFSSIAVAPGGDVWVGTFSEAVQHFDGETVTSHDPGIDGKITSIALDRDENPWVGALGALAHFDGEVWTVYDTENTELVRLNVNAIAIDQNGNKWIGTDEGLAVFNETGVVTSAEREPANSGIPDRIVLHGNYPNPFNPSTTFAFDLPEPADVRLAVYDALGREVFTVVSQRLNAGRHHYAWDAGNLTSGVYFYRLDTGEFSATRKMVLVN